ncbi:hypothetical protein AVEN_111931-1 [Araneus ventricosus]|uniref:Uncharacterized protein n=1 Tax=Araneus ventricosus TaxID=182803 RepID=A0A4Y2L1V5_ARAVE|nr:hypothetical protein AVEN_111931-1 [Araneus ventricosus]
MDGTDDVTHSEFSRNHPFVVHVIDIDSLYWYMGRINQCYLWAVLSTSSTGGASAYFGNYHATTFAGNSLFSNFTAKRGEELTWIKMASCPMFTNCCGCGALILLKITNFKSTLEPSAGMRNCSEDCLNFGVVRF